MTTTEVSLIIQWSATSGKYAHTYTSRPLATDAIRRALLLNGMPTRAGTNGLLKTISIDLSEFIGLGVPEETIALFCAFVGIIADYLFHTTVSPRNARKVWYKLTTAWFRLTYGEERITLSATAGGAKIQFVSSDDTVILLDLINALNGGPRRLIEFLDQHHALAAPIIEVVANETMHAYDPHVLAHLQKAR